MALFPNLKRAANALGLPLGEVSWRAVRGVSLHFAVLAEVDRELAKLSKGEIDHYAICVAAVARLDFEAFADPLLRKHCKDYRKRINDHDVVECALERIAICRK